MTESSGMQSSRKHSSADLKGARLGALLPAQGKLPGDGLHCVGLGNYSDTIPKSRDYARATSGRTIRSRHKAQITTRAAVDGKKEERGASLLQMLCPHTHIRIVQNI